MRLVPEKSSLPRLLVFPFGLLAVAGLVLLRFQSDLVLRLAHCPLREITGLPCPTCGGTHAAVDLVQGRWMEALRANPLVVFGFVLFGLWLAGGLLATVLPQLRRDIQWTTAEKRTARILAVLLLVATWVWEIRTL